MIDIPLKAKNDEEFTTLKEWEKECVVYAVLCNVDNQTAFLRYNPHFAISVGKTKPKFALSDEGKKQNRNFWSYPKVRAYRESYENTLAEFLGRKQTSRNVDTDIDDNRIEGALKKLLNHTIGLLDNGDNLDPDSVKTIVEVFRKMNLLKDEVEQQEAPRRYLPERCSACLYKSFVESHVESGEIENACLRCKALKAAQEQGFRYDPTNLLEPIKENENDKEKDKTE